MSITQDEIPGKKAPKSTLKGLNKIIAYFYPVSSLTIKIIDGTIFFPGFSLLNCRHCGHCIIIHQIQGASIFLLIACFLYSRASPLLVLENNKIPTPTFKNTRQFRIRRSCASQPTSPLLVLENNKISTPTFKSTRQYLIRRSCASQPTAEAITSLLQLFFNDLKFSSKCKFHL